MSFSVYVTTPHEQTPPPEDDIQHQEWLEIEKKFCLYDEPIDGDSSFYEHWHVFAAELKLQYLRQVYKNGLKIQTETEFQALEDEVFLLMKHWRNQLSRKILQSQSPNTYLLSHLYERASLLLIGINIARNESAILSIS